MNDVTMMTLLLVWAVVTSLVQCMTLDVVSLTCSDAAKRCDTDVTCRVMLDVFSQACDESGKT